MQRFNFRIIAKSIFAFTIFLFGAVYITNAGSYAHYFDPIPGSIILVYITAFVDVSIALSMILNVHVRNACVLGGIYWLLVSLTTFVIQLYNASVNANPALINEAIITLISALGYTSAIFYIGFVEE